MTCGIYKITNKTNGKAYIGQSIHIEKRWIREKQEAFCKGSKSYDYILSRAFRKYGIDQFSFEILEECSRKKLDEREKYYISLYNTYYNGYNATFGGDSSGISRNKEKIVGIVNDLATTSMKHEDIAKKWDLSIEMVQGINTGRYHYQDNIDYPIQKVKHNKSRQKKYCIDCGIEIASTSTRCQACSNRQFSYLGRTGNDYPTKEELQKLLKDNFGNFSLVGRIYGVTDNTIRKWCKKNDLPTHSIDYQPRKEVKQSKPLKRAVAQLDKENNIIATFPSITEAGRSIGVDRPAHIGDVCSGKRKTAYGYKWKYIESV